MTDSSTPMRPVVTVGMNVSDTPSLPEDAPPRPRRLRAIDLLRGSAALGVVVAHAFLTMSYPPDVPWWLRWAAVVAHEGGLGVPLFFVISGFCIHLRWARQKAAGGNPVLDYAAFWRRRIMRLYPPYFVTLCLSMAMIFICYFSHINVPLVTNYPVPRLHWMTADFFAHLFMLHGFYPVFDRAGGDGPFWTLAREEYFYLLYLPLLACRRRWGLKKALIGVFCISLVFPVIYSPFVSLSSPWHDLLETSALTLWLQWCLGMLAVEAYFGIIKLPAWCSNPVALVLALIASRLAQSYCVYLAALGWGLSMFIFVNLCVRIESSREWPRNRLFNWLCSVGIFSYSLYLVHEPIRSVLSRVLGPYDLVHRPGYYMLAMVIMMVAGYIGGWIFFQIVEKHFLEASKPTIVRSSELTPSPAPHVHDRQHEPNSHTPLRVNRDAVIPRPHQG